MEPVGTSMTVLKTYFFIWGFEKEGERERGERLRRGKRRGREFFFPFFSFFEREQPSRMAPLLPPIRAFPALSAPLSLLLLHGQLTLRELVAGREVVPRVGDGGGLDGDGLVRHFVEIDRFSNRKKKKKGNFRFTIGCSPPGQLDCGESAAARGSLSSWKRTEEESEACFFEPAACFAGG